MDHGLGEDRTNDGLEPNRTGEGPSVVPKDSQLKQDRVPLITWFLGFGFVDLIVSVIAAYVLHAPVSVLRVLLPTLFWMGGNPASPQGFELVVAVFFLFGGSFLVYGLAGVVVGLITRAIVKIKNTVD